MNERDRFLGSSALILVTLFWGLSFPLVGGAVEGRSLPEFLLFLTLRFSIASLAFAPVFPALLRALSMPGGRGSRPWLDALWIGVLFFFGFVLQTWGLAHTTPSRSAFVTVMSVPMVPFVAALWQRRPISRKHVGASSIALLGVALVLAPDGTPKPNLGDALTFLSAIFFALTLVWIERAARRSPVVILAFGQVFAMALLSALALPLVSLGSDIELALWPGLLQAALLTGVLCTTLGLGLMTWGQARVSAETAAILFALEPIWAAVFEMLLSDYRLNLLQWSGGLVVCAAVAVSARLKEPPASRQPGAVSAR